MCRSLVSWESSPQPLPDPPKQKATRMDGSRRCSGGCKSVHSHLQGRHAASPSAGMGTSRCIAVPCPAWCFGDSPSPLVRSRRKYPRSEDCEIVRPDLLLCAGTVLGEGASCVGAGLGHHRGQDAVTLCHRLKRWDGSQLKLLMPLQQVNDSKETFLSCVLRAGRDAGIFSRSCLGWEWGVRHAWDWEHGHTGLSRDFMEAPQDPGELGHLSPPRSWFLMALLSCFDPGAPALSSANTYIYN